MLDKTIDLIVKYTILKGYAQIDKKDKIINYGLEYLESKINGDIKDDKERLGKIEQNKKRIEAKNAV